MSRRKERRENEETKETKGNKRRGKKWNKTSPQDTGSDRGSGCCKKREAGRNKSRNQKQKRGGDEAARQHITQRKTGGCRCFIRACSCSPLSFYPSLASRRAGCRCRFVRVRGKKFRLCLILEDFNALIWEPFITAHYEHGRRAVSHVSGLMRKREETQARLPSNVIICFYFCFLLIWIVSVCSAAYS